MEWFLERQTKAKLHINELPLIVTPIPVAIDVETDEKDNFVCLSLCADESNVWFFNSINSLLISTLQYVKLIGQNGKGDLKWLKGWGIDVPIENYVFDTMLASNVQNSLRDSHALKPLSKAILGIQYPSYNSIVRVGRKRVTLDKQPLEITANYNALDAYATYRLYKHFDAAFTPVQRRVFYDVEMPINRLLYEMETKGIQVDINCLAELDTEFGQKLKDILQCIKEMTKEDVRQLVGTYEDKKRNEYQETAYNKFKDTGEFNPGSWQQKKFLLEFLGYEIEKTDKAALNRFKGEKLINLLLEYSEFKKLYSSFITPIKELPSLPTIHPTFNQVSESRENEDMAFGIATGRLSCKSPNLQQIPRRTEQGNKLRKLFVARPGHLLVVADYGQIEKRLQAHFSHDPVLIGCFNDPARDLFQETADQLHVDRDTAKQVHYALDFGATAWKLKDVLHVSEKEAQNVIDAYWKMFRVNKMWREQVLREARTNGGVTTIIGEFKAVDRAALTCSIAWQREAEERATISKKVQGSAAAIIKLAMLKCKFEGNYVGLLSVHDEMVVEVLKETAEYDSKRIKGVMETAITLDVPLPVDVGIGASWEEAKNNA